jgi:hypothetical protein
MKMRWLKDIGLFLLHVTLHAVLESFLIAFVIV